MRIEDIFRTTAIQKEAISILNSKAMHILLYGGSRSGKTSLLVMAIILRAMYFPSSCHLICRRRATDAWSSVLHQTLFPLLRKNVGPDGYKFLKHEGAVFFPNGSEIWIGGLGDKKQADKILGHEYNTIYFNEISEISYVAVTTAHSRLARVTPGCKNLFLYDCNPGSPLHWAYKEFILKISFLTGAKLSDPDLYAALRMNPADNQENLPENYVSDILGNLPEKQRARFRDGVWVIPEGAIYGRFEESMIVKENDLPETFDYFTSGQDFGLNITNVKVGWKGNAIYVLADYGAFNMPTKTFNEELHARGWFRDDMPVYCDPSGGERIQEITGGVKANNSVESGIDYICAKIERNEFFVSEKCAGVLSEIWDYRRDEAGQIVKANDHYMDAMRYAIFSDAQRGIVVA